MSTIEDKILDGPRIHYCEGEDDDMRQGNDVDENHANSERNNNSDSLFTRPDEESERLARYNNIKWQSGSSNTGPKGVIEDYKKRSSTKEQKNQEIDELEAEFQELLNDDSLLREFVSKRISDAVKSNTPIFGQVYRLQTGNQLLDAIDNENPNVLVLVHIYTKYSRSCSNLNHCLNDLASEWKYVKFVTLDAGATSLSGNFKENGVPALLAYRGGILIKSLVQLNELLDKDFDVAQVKELLIDNGLTGIRSS